jgi:2,3-bisphosphoglycerate-dependent phosphoglycerate mutase
MLYRLLLAALAASASAVRIAPSAAPHAKLVFLRHGQSTWNQLNLFTGWVDVELSELGFQEATAGGVELKKAGIEFDVAYTSLLQRAQETCRIALEQSEQTGVPVIKDFRLNERHYGALQGKDKKETVAEFGEAQVKLWRRSYDIPPPPVEPGSEHDPKVNPLYAHVDPAMLPSCECLKDTVARCLPLWDEQIAPQLEEGKTVLVAAHGNSIRGLLKFLDGIDDDEITGVEIPTGIPLVYELDSELRPIPAAGCVAPLRGSFLGDAAAIAEAQAKVAAQTAVAKPPEGGAEAELLAKLDDVLPLRLEKERADAALDLLGFPFPQEFA